MGNRALDIRIFTIYPKRDKKDFTSISDIDGCDFLELLRDRFKAFINALELKQDESEASPPKAIGITEKIDDDGNIIPLFVVNEKLRFITGKISTGHYGEEGSVIDLDKNKVFKIERSHAIPKPFFFFICMPANKNKGFIVTERVGQSGITSLFSWTLSNFFNNHFSNYTIKIDRFVEESIVKKHILDGSYEEVTLKTINLPSNIEEKYGLVRYNDTEYTVELKIIPKNKVRGITGQMKQKIQRIFNGENINFLNFEEGFQQIGIDRNATISVVSTYNRNKRTIKIDDPFKMRTCYDVSIALDEDGHSKFESLVNVTYELLDGLELDIFNNAFQN